jgi:hypothetical protein
MGRRRVLASVVGQDLEKGDTGGLWIGRRVAPDRIISTVDPEAGGHKTSARASTAARATSPSIPTPRSSRA